MVRNTWEIIVFGLITSFNCKTKKPITLYRRERTVDGYTVLVDHFSTACNYANIYGLSLLLRYVLKLMNKLRVILTI